MTQTYYLPRFDSQSTAHYAIPNSNAPYETKRSHAQPRGRVETDKTSSTIYGYDQRISTSHKSCNPSWSRVETESTTILPRHQLQTRRSSDIKTLGDHEQQQIEVITILTSDIISPSSGAEIEFIAASLAGLMRSSGISFPNLPRRTDWAKIHRALDNSYRDKPLTQRSGHRKVIWTRLARTIIDPETLMEAGEPFELRADNLILKREMSREEVVELVKKGMKLREEKERAWIDGQAVGEPGRWELMDDRV